MNTSRLIPFRINSRKLVFAFATFIIVTTGFTGCYNSDDVGGNLYTFTDKMMGQYLKDSTQFSEFSKLLDTTKVNSLLNAYGSYTCFAPDNNAMKAFYKLKGKTSLKDFSLDSLKIIAYDHIINGNTVLSSQFNNGRLADQSMSERYFLISYLNGVAYVNKTSQIVGNDIIVHNGVIHRINQVLNPTSFGIVEAITNDSVFSIFSQALLATGLADSLMKDRDNTYDPAQYKDLAVVGSWYIYEVPQSRKFGYTALMESNSTMRANGINNLETMKAYAKNIYDVVYPDDANVTDITDRRNSLNRFIAYHLINKELSYSKFIDDYVMYNNSFANAHMIDKTGVNMYEYIEPMCPNTLIEITRKGGTQFTNLINRDPDTDQSIGIVKSNSDNDATNGVFHEIDGMLTYNSRVKDILSSKRLRFDAASFFPELTNNNMRGRGLTNPNLRFPLPKGYVDRISCSDQTVVGYLTPYDGYLDYEGDEIFLRANTGSLYDFTITTPPVPEGTYEVRFGYLANGNRGVAQFYFDNVPCGVPLNLNNTATNPSIGWIMPGSVPDDPYGYENDKMMRNRGYMKGPADYTAPNKVWYSGASARMNPVSLRRILGTYTFTKAGNHYLTVKGLSSGEFMFDYLEFVPTSALETEDIY